MQRFRALTTGHSVIMGRKTWESIPEKFRPLEGRNNIVVTSNHPPIGAIHDEPLCYTSMSVKSAVDAGHTLPSRGNRDVWFIGGERIYKEAMQYADVIDVTHVTDLYTHSGTYGIITYFPPIDESVFMPGPIESHPTEPLLKLQRFERRFGLKDNKVLQEAGVLTRTRKT